MTNQMTSEPLYTVWWGIIARCRYRSCTGYINYGGRGITMCQEWQASYPAFRDWALAHGYRAGLQIDRIDNDGNYSPSNCRWVTHSINCRNRRNTRYYTVHDITLCRIEWATIVGCNQRTLDCVRRLRGEDGVVNYITKRLQSPGLHGQVAA